MTKKEILAIAKPILFNTEMVRAILEGRKSCTRRVIKHDNNGIWSAENDCRNSEYGASVPCYRSRKISVDDTSPNTVYPKYDVGDYLYVRETYCWCPCWDCGMYTEKGCQDDTADRFYNEQKKENGCYGYKASFETGELPFDKWTPSIHMPKEAARIFLRVTDIRVERLQDITIDGIEHEGIKSEHLTKFINLWDSTVKEQDIDCYGWKSNPWIWAIEFERVIIDE